jgi:uncharacterized protein (DUF885 family)
VHNAAYDAFAADFHAHFTRDANACVYLGVPHRLDELPDPTVAGARDRVREATELLARLDGVSAAADLTFDQALDLDLARLMLRAEIHRETYTFNGRTEAEQKPTAGDDIGEGIFGLFIADPRDAADRLADVAARIEGVPDHLEAMLDRLDTPVRRWVDVDLEEAAGFSDLFETMVAWAKREEWSDLARLERAVGEARAAVGSYRERLAAMPTTDRIHVGEETAQRIVGLAGIDLSLAELHGMARDFLAETGEVIEVLRRRLVEKYELDPGTTPDELQSELDRRFVVEPAGGDPQRVLDRYEAERERILAFNARERLFPILADQDMRILRSPPFMEPTIPAGAMMGPAPFRAGTRLSIVYLTLPPERLPEHTELSIPGMMVHEGIPGHHLQTATASLHPSIIRRHGDVPHHAEGWTTMLEDYMLDVGYMDDLADEARFGAKRDISRLGARVAIDLFLMSGNRDFLDVGVECDVRAPDPFEAAGNLLAAVTGFTPRRVEGELNWYSKARGYPLSYLVGNRLVLALKRDVVAAGRRRTPPREGRDFDREFHRVYLESGNIPVSFLRRVYEHEGLLG